MKSLIHISKPFWISTLLLLTICPAMGQIKKMEKVTEKDYHLWSTIRQTSISDNGKWVSYNLSYESHEDTLFVKSTINQKIFSLSKAYEGSFLNDTYFGYLLPSNKFQLLNLETGVTFNFENITHFHSTTNAIILKEEQNRKNTLHICNDEGKIKRSITDVTYYKIDPTGTKMIYVVSSPTNSLVMLDFQKNKETIINTNSILSYPIVKWDTKGTTFLFAMYSNSTKNYEALFFYNIAMKKLWECNTKNISNSLGEMDLDVRYDNLLAISDNHDNILFTVQKKDKTPINEKKDGIEIWNSKDKDLFPLRKQQGLSKNNSKVAIWSIKTNTLKLISDDIHPQSLVNPNQINAIVYNEDQNKPNFKQEPDINYWLLNTKTGTKTPFLVKQSASEKYTSFSPDGKYFLYFRNENWWLYCFENQKHTKLTQNDFRNFIDYTYQDPGIPFPYGYAGWTQNDQTVLLYDQFDIWEFNTKTGKGEQLTFGRENHDVYRLVNPKYAYNGTFVSKEQVIIPGKNLLLKIKKNINTSFGFSYLDSNRKLQPIVYDSAYVHNIVKAKNTNHFIYLKEKFNVPPTLMLTNNNTTNVLLQTNPQHYKYEWGISRLISYKNSKGLSLNAVLHYPAGFVLEKKYPMIVSIYQKQTSQLHVYTNPSNLNGCSFNVTNYTNDGYFVLLPDINYELGNTGYSALDCVTSAVSEVIKSYPIDNEKIGLIGHSFGGYETDFIITQTNMFAAAIAGAAITNFNSNYLAYNKANFKPETWRFEYFQMRMGKTLFDDYNNYQNNSPVTHAANISTPLLAYTGNADLQVDQSQSKEYYLALRRLQKEHILLIYPNENHVFTKPENQIDLTKKRAEWFGYYLKDLPKPQWMEAL